MNPTELTVLCKERPQACDANLLKLAAFMGIPARSVPSSGGSARLDREVAPILGQGICLAASARTLREMKGAELSELTGSGTGGRAGHLLVYGFDPAAGDSELVDRLTHGILRSVRPPAADEDQYAFCSDAPALCHGFSGLAFGPVAAANDLVFERGREDSRVADYVRVGRHPLMAAAQDGAWRTVLVGTRTILDIDSAAPDETLLQRFSELVPAMLFLRGVFGDRCWQGTARGACFIVDDPTLRRRYGFLRYESLVRAMDGRDFSMSVSFIPWNCRRSQPEAIEIFKRHPALLSLSVHGCDHTGGEFAAADEPLLCRKARLALERMNAHQALTGIPFDPVMVFPQGAFSPAALHALKAAGYLAAVNSSAFPQVPGGGDLSWRELLDLAVTRHGGFPLFVRHYPRRLEQFAFDLFLGKPALVVEHHGYFREGYDKLAEFIAKLNRLDGPLQWANLGNVVCRAGLRRTDESGTVHVRFFTDRFILENSSNQPRDFLLERPCREEDELTVLGETGGELECSRQNGLLTVPLHLAPGGATEVVIRRTQPPPRPTPAQSLSEDVRVFARRHLSEFRDDHLDRIRFVGSIARRARKLLK